MTWCDLGDANVDEAISEQVSRFAELHRPWEWELYSYDRPPDLPRRLRAAGLVPDPVEALMVAEISDLDLNVTPGERGTGPRRRRGWRAGARAGAQ